MTLREFEAAIWAAWAQLFLTTDEAYAAIAKYEAELADRVTREIGEG